MQEGAPHQHMIAEHKTSITRRMLEENTKILHKAKNLRRLQMLEALYINKLAPSRNVQAPDYYTAYSE
ncbi:hypothetical protein SK128_013828, partial [Halocaridina rubra]